MAGTGRVNGLNGGGMAEKVAPAGGRRDKRVALMGGLPAAARGMPGDAGAGRDDGIGVTIVRVVLRRGHRSLDRDAKDLSQQLAQ
jgi:hypothetical protein